MSEDRVPNFEFTPIVADGWKCAYAADGKLKAIPLYSRRTQYREHGQWLIKDILQACTLDLREGPTT